MKTVLQISIATILRCFASFLLKNVFCLNKMNPQDTAENTTRGERVRLKWVY